MSESMGQLVLSFYSAASSKFIFVLAKAETDSTICTTYRVSQKKHSYKIFGLEIMLFTCSQVRTPQQLHEMGHSAGVHHSLQDYYVCEQVKSMISSPKIL